MRHAFEVIEAGAAHQATQFDSDFPIDPVWILGDSSEIEELFLNLLTNALEAVADLPIGSRFINASLKINDSSAIAKISDSGSGIPSHLMSEIFTPFVSTKARGSGLGLAICRGIVERHSGRLVGG